jgi:hypothetical protein
MITNDEFGWNVGKWFSICACRKQNYYISDKDLNHLTKKELSLFKIFYI